MESILSEPSAAIALAGLAEHRAAFAGKRVAMIITGAHLNASLMSEVIECDPLL
ncbi:MAG: hypothetical protein O3A47_09055 [Chloroflexi bacterium]|nr:hypothetical protein [Chloroflexota bacterium]